MDIIDNDNTSSEHWNGSGLNLSKYGKGNLAMNSITKIRKLRRKNLN